MTENQFRHHQEQMEAIRRDFLQFWQEVILPGLRVPGDPPLGEREVARRMDLSWKTYLKSKQQ